MRSVKAAVLTIVVAALAPGAAAWGMPATNLAAVIDLQERAKRQAAVYEQVRDAVQAGRLPAADLQVARLALRDAQAAMYDQIDTARHSAAARLRALRRQNERRLGRAEADLAEAEAALAAAAAPDRPVAAARVALDHELVEGYRREAERYAEPPPAVVRPKLPVLPPARAAVAE